MVEKAVTAFWGEMSACEHFVQVYENDAAFIEILTDFIGTGLIKGESAVVIATAEHRRELDRRLALMGLNVEEAKSQNQFVSIDAQDTLDRFLINGWPDDRCFTVLVKEILNRVSSQDRKIRAFGEMVALLWAQGHCGATVRLEQLWTDMCQKMSLPLFCAYPRVGFTEPASESIARLCAAHSKVLAA